NAPESVGTSLDWAIKLALYSDRIHRRGFAWASVEQWSRVIKSLKGAPEKTEHRNSPLAAALVTDAHAPELQARIAERAYNLYEGRGCRGGSHLDDWLRAEREIMTVRAEVQALAPLPSETG